MLSRIRGLLNDRKGVTAIEFALIAPILFLLTFGIIEYSLVMFTSSAIESATHIGSRLGKTGYVDPAAPTPGPAPITRENYIRQLIRARVGRLINYSNLIIESKVYPTLPAANGSPGDPTGSLGGGGQVVEYTVRYKWPILTPIMKQFLGDQDGNFNIVSTMLVRNEEF